ncbi:DUF4390 domain-containing protein [bacterium]|nr:DUF4390 domain-containing protein [bacterium]RQV96318.1 MAG: DUF4390 domain-containing protein [bacterium]
MNHKGTYYIFAILLVFSSLGFSNGKKYGFENIGVEEGVLIFDFELFDLFSEDIIRGLRKGMTAAIEYQVQLWEERRHWFDRVVAEKSIRMKVGYDSWEQSFILTRPEEGPVLLSESHIQDRCSRLDGFHLVDLNQLKAKGRYTLVVKMILQPLSVDNYEEIKRWLAGEVQELNPRNLKSTESPDEKAGDWLLGLVLNLTGFGDRAITAESPAFHIENGSVVLEEEE